MDDRSERYREVRGAAGNRDAYIPQIRNIDFFTLTDTIEMKVGKQKLLRLSADIDNYSDLQLVWNPKKKGLIGCCDVEHQTYTDLCSFTEFLASPEMHLVKFLEGEA